MHLAPTMTAQAELSGDSSSASKRSISQELLKQLRSSWAQDSEGGTPLDPALSLPSPAELLRNVADGPGQAAQLVGGWAERAAQQAGLAARAAGTDLGGAAVGAVERLCGLAQGGGDVEAGCRAGVERLAARLGEAAGAALRDVRAPGLQVRGILVAEENQEVPCQTLVSAWCFLRCPVVRAGRGGGRGGRGPVRAGSLPGLWGRRRPRQLAVRGRGGAAGGDAGPHAKALMFGSAQRALRFWRMIW